MDSETAPELAVATNPPPDEPEIAALPFPPYTTDDELIELWLHGKSLHTIRAYRDDIAAFRTFTGKSLRATYLSDLQKYADTLQGALATRSRGASIRVCTLSQHACVSYAIAV